MRYTYIFVFFLFCISLFTFFDWVGQPTSTTPMTCGCWTGVRYGLAHKWPQGSGQWGASLALLSALISIEFFAEPSPLDCIMPTPASDVEINPSADGRCFFSCLYLHSASTDEKQLWANAERNAQGFPIASSRQKTEARCEQILVLDDLGVVMFFFCCNANDPELWRIAFIRHTVGKPAS